MVAEKSPSPDTMIEGIDEDNAIWIASFLSRPFIRSFLYLVVSSIA
jgi:hypothetical protein